MDDDGVRELLTRYRPVGPDAGLRQRALSHAAARPERAWPWAAAAAALIAATVGFNAASDRAIATTRPAPIDSVDALSAAMGGGEEAESTARLIVAEQTFFAWLTADETTAETFEEQVNGVN